MPQILLLTAILFSGTILAKKPNSNFIFATEAYEIVQDLFNPNRNFHITKQYHYQFKDRLTVIVSGQMAGNHYEALVDDKSSRVFYLKINGEMVFEWKGIEVIAHRGALKHAPENTMPAFAKAIELGADRIELDVRQTKDGEMIVIHDPTVNRTTNGRGTVQDLTLAEIKKLDAGSWFDDQFRGQKVPTLREALKFIDKRTAIEIDFKAGNTDSLLQILSEHDVLYTSSIYVKDYRRLAKLKAADPNLFLKTIPGHGKSKVEKLAQDQSPSVVNVKWLVYKQGMAKNIHEKGMLTCLNSLRFDHKVLIDKMIDDLPDFIITDKLDYVLSQLRQKGLHH